LSQGTGPLGGALIPSLLRNGFTVAVVSRPNGKSSSGLPSEVIVKTSEYTDVATLVVALEGQDALVEAFNPASAIHQGPILEAALAAGVRHIITPDFSSDTFNPNVHETLLLENKLKAKKVLKVVVAAHPNTLSWTAIIVGPWYDWLIEKDYFWVNKHTKTITCVGSGDQKVSISRYEVCGEALVAVLQSPAKYRNRPAYFANHTVSTNELISIVKDHLGLEGWNTVHVPLDELSVQAHGLWDKDTADGVVNRLATKAYPLLATVAMMNEENRYEADFSHKLEAGWEQDIEVLVEKLRRILV
jgi:nucleoside-diphosphate-sugar epimerase